MQINKMNHTLLLLYNLVLVLLLQMWTFQQQLALRSHLTGVVDRIVAHFLKGLKVRSAVIGSERASCNLIVCI